MNLTRVGLGRLLVLLLPVVLVATPDRAEALDEGERQLSVTASVAHLRQGEGAVTGPGGGLELQQAMTDSWAIRGALESGWLWADAAREDLVLTRLSAGLTWAYDVLRVVPFVEASVGVADLRGDLAGDRQAVGLEGGLGAQYVLNRRWVAAVVLRGAVWPVHLAGDDGGVPKLAAVALRIGRVFQ